MTIHEHIQLNDDYRLAVHYDEGPSCPRGDWDMITGFVKIQGMGDSRLADVPAVHDDPTGRILEAESRFGALGWTAQDGAYRTARPTRNIGLTEQTVARWARIFHGIHLEHDAEHGGYWFCDPTQFEANFPDVGDGKVKRSRRAEGTLDTYVEYEQDKLEVQAEIIKQEQETYRQWADGEVYGVTLEEKRTYARILPGGVIVGGETREEWEEVDDCAIWGCYLDDEYTAFVVAKEHFALPEDTESSASSQHYIDTGKYLVIGEAEHGK